MAFKKYDFWEAKLLSGIAKFAMLNSVWSQLVGVMCFGAKKNGSREDGCYFLNLSGL